MIKILAKLLTGTLCILLLFIVGNTLRFGSQQVPPASPAPDLMINIDQAAARLAAAIALPTISYQQPDAFQPQPFTDLVQLIDESFPAVATALEKTPINDYSLLFKWPGSDPSLKPLAFLGHLDVVPADPNTIDQWQYPPFAGVIAEDAIWGRGALDNKSVVFALLEAVEYLLGEGIQPQHTIYLAFGHDEEIGGGQGAARIVEHLQQQGESLLLTLDEGMMVFDESLSPAKQLTGIIGIAEKGYLTLNLSAEVSGGHSSMPTKITAVGELAKAINALEAQQMPSSLSGASGAMFDYLGPEMGVVERALFANRWLFGGVVERVLENTESTAALIRTTTAVTMLNAGVKENVLPSKATAVVNFRLRPGDSVEQVINHVRRVIDNPSISVDILAGSSVNEASKISATDTKEFLLIGQTIAQVFDNALYTPGLVVAGTDSKHYQVIAENNYRFAPFVVGNRNLEQIHGLNERIAVADYRRMIEFYIQLLRGFNEL